MWALVVDLGGSLLESLVVDEAVALLVVLRVSVGSGSLDPGLRTVAEVEGLLIVQPLLLAMPLLAFIQLPFSALSTKL